MPVTWYVLLPARYAPLLIQSHSLVRWKNATGMRDFTYIAEHVTKSLHGKNMGQWGLWFKVYRDVNPALARQQQQQQMAPKDSKLMYQVSLAQQPGRVYCMVDGSVVVEAEKEIEVILSRLKNLWQLRQNVYIEVGSSSMLSISLRAIFFSGRKLRNRRLHATRRQYLTWLDLQGPLARGNRRHSSPILPLTWLIGYLPSVLNPQYQLGPDSRIYRIHRPVHSQALVRVRIQLRESRPEQQ